MLVRNNAPEKRWKSFKNIDKRHASVILVFIINTHLPQLVFRPFRRRPPRSSYVGIAIVASKSRITRGLASRLIRGALLPWVFAAGEEEEKDEIHSVTVQTVSLAASFNVIHGLEQPARNAITAVLQLSPKYFLLSTQYSSLPPQRCPPSAVLLSHIFPFFLFSPLFFPILYHLPVLSLFI